jgi:hypothetical protein
LDDASFRLDIAHEEVLMIFELLQSTSCLIAWFTQVNLAFYTYHDLLLISCFVVVGLAIKTLPLVKVLRAVISLNNHFSLAVNILRKPVIQRCQFTCVFIKLFKFMEKRTFPLGLVYLSHEWIVLAWAHTAKYYHIDEACNIYRQIKNFHEL